HGLEYRYNLSRVSWCRRQQITAPAPRRIFQIIGEVYLEREEPRVAPHTVDPAAIDPVQAHMNAGFILRMSTTWRSCRWPRPGREDLRAVFWLFWPRRRAPSGSDASSPPCGERLCHVPLAGQRLKKSRFSSAGP